MTKSTSAAPYCFVSGESNSSKASKASLYILNIRQQPIRAKICGAKERDRRPIDPPPIVQIRLADPSSDKNKDYLQSPYLFMCCNLVHANDPSGEIVAPAHRALAGTVVSSLNRLKDVDNSDGGFFVFGDISVRIEGHFRLRFSLFELVKGEVFHVMSAVSNPMTVHSSKTFPGMSESTFLSRSFSDQGVRIRIRKDHHVKPKRHMSIDATEESQAAMHSPPSSCHEADHSDSEHIQISHPGKRPKSFSIVSSNSSRQASMDTHPKHPDGYPSAAELSERTPPSSPGPFMGQDPVPSKSRHHQHYTDLSPGQHEEHHCLYPSSYCYAPHHRTDRPSSFSKCHCHESSSRRQNHSTYPYPAGASRPSHPKDISRQPDRHPEPHSSHLEHHDHCQYPARSRYHCRHYHRPSHEAGHPYVERYSSSYHGHYPPSYSMGAAHPFLSSVHNSRPLYPCPSALAHHALPHPSAPHPSVPSKFKEPAPRHGFPAALLNDQDMECVPSPGYYHSRTPSMSSQQSEGNFSPLHPVSPPETQAPIHGLPPHRDMPPAHNVPTSHTGPTPLVFAQIPSRTPVAGEGVSTIQLPSIQSLSTRSPIIPGHPFMEAAPARSYYVRPECLT
ncbi:velvet factor-domain-containing protein [Gamsiella multidivaricata]|uniref:velvet factor-domain-containing protein n=1 Tax=Gamsiella multidivaricata TaxID=101098 RepID=UPI00221E5EDB|nr:velvet factor-domain-containing protein [Gamsiella multidivaricata]KAG0358240.1 hypothetical protein BGZ54_010510 [Gamsiella multidivaricata]KAI7826559.1 velvet factor-domain-containing protein [Gamsiella multidivaricata]